MRQVTSVEVLEEEKGCLTHINLIREMEGTGHIILHEPIKSDAIKASLVRQKEVDRVVKDNDLFFTSVYLFVSIIIFLGLLVYFFMSKDGLTLSRFIITLIPIFSVQALRPFYRFYAAHRANVDLDQAYSVQRIAEIKDSMVAFPSITEYVSKVFAETGKFTLLDMAVAKNHIEDRIDRSRIEYAKGGKLNQVALKKDEDELEVVTEHCLYLSSYVFER